MEKKVMSDYSCYCTAEQTKKALELGAPIMQFKSAYVSESVPHCVEYKGGVRIVTVFPTAEQMRIWLEKQGFYFRTNTIGSSVEIDFSCIYEDNSICYPEGIIAAIDAALEYLSKHK